MPPAPDVSLRPARPADVTAIAGIWHQGWQDGHRGNVPDELTAARTEDSFATRARERVAHATVAVVADRVAGFTVVVGDEVEQVYVAEGHRGSAVAPALLAAAEDRVAASGHRTAWLAVAGGNARARRFYARHGWADAGLFDYEASGPDGPIVIPVHRYVKDV